MAKPWEKYQEEAPVEETRKPWEKFGSTSEEKTPEVEPEPESLGHSALRHAIDIVPPIAGAMGGAAIGSGLGPLGTAAGGGLGYAAGQELSGLARHHLLGEELPSTEPIEQAKRVAGNVAMGSAAELGAPVLAKGAEVVAGAIPKAINAAAEKLAISSAGLSKAAPKTGRALLDEGVVAPFSTRAQVQEGARKASETAGEEIGEALEQVKEQANPLKVIKQLQDKIDEYSKLPGSENVVKKLIKIQESFLEHSKKSNIPGHLKEWSANELEQIKRRYQDMVNYTRQQRIPQTTQANKEAADVFRNHVEGMANKAGPEVENQFLNAKEKYGALAPVVKEANKPNLYHELGKDAAAYGAGEAYDAVTGKRGHGLAFALARRIGQTTPVTSTAAAGANAVGKGLQAAGKILPSASTAGRIGSYLITPKVIQKSITPLQGLIKHITPTVTQPGLPKENQAAIMHSGMMKNLAQVDQQNPNLLSKSGLNLPEMERHIANHASKMSNLGEFKPNATENKLTPNPKGTLMSRFKQIKTPSGPAQVGRAVYEQSPEQLKSMANALQSSGDENKAHMGNSLVKAIDNKDYIAKNAILFNLLQSPQTRRLIKSELPEDQGNNNGQEDER